MKLPQELYIVFVSMLPISELRGALPLAVLKFDYSIPKAYFLSVVGNLIPIYPILLLFDPIAKFFSERIEIGRKFFDWLERRTRKRAKVVEKYELLGLFMFVAIPLPMTGAWTGALAATVFRIPPKKAFPFIVLGVFSAGIIVTTLILLGYLGAIVAAVLLFSPAIGYLLRLRRKIDT